MLVREEACLRARAAAALGKLPGQHLLPMLPSISISDRDRMLDLRSSKLNNNKRNYGKFSL